jgi:hypothetical protein
LGTGCRLSINAILFLLCTSTLYAIDAYGITTNEAISKETLDINLNSIYLTNRTQKNAGVLGEIILQLPYPISEAAKKTGIGPFGGITYLDYKSLMNTSTQLATVFGLGRIYYSTSAPGETPTTFVPYLTWYRALFIDYKDSNNSTIQGKTNAWLTPGFMYAYRFNKKTTFHLDAELYSYSKRLNNRLRFGFSYLPKWPMIFSVSYERTSWDLSENIQGNDFVLDGNHRELSAKVIIRDPPNGNFSLIVGYGQLRNAAEPAYFQQSATSSNGHYFGVEASAGVLAW